MDLIKEFEGLYLSAYPDPLSGGRPYTIGWGSTRTSTGGEWKLGDTITEDTARELLIDEIQRRTLPGVRTIPTWIQMNDNQRGAILSFAFNLGEGFYGKPNFETISRALSRVENFADVPKAMLLYVNPGSNVEAGLRRRREAEGCTFTTPMLEDAKYCLRVKHIGDAGERCKNGQPGVCGTPASCKTVIVRGFCNGGTDKVCCAPPAVKTSAPAGPGIQAVGDAGQPCKNGLASICTTFVPVLSTSSSLRTGIDVAFMLFLVLSLI